MLQLCFKFVFVCLYKCECVVITLLVAFTSPSSSGNSKQLKGEGPPFISFLHNSTNLSWNIKRKKGSSMQLMEESVTGSESFCINTIPEFSGLLCRASLVFNLPTLLAKSVNH